ncbi:hypothetical protein V8C42DRAFT_359194 [Trichoderma barbatum]
MGREHSSSRRSKSHSSKHKICKALGCDRERRSKSHDGERSKFCKKHSNQSKSSMDTYVAAKTSSDAYSDAFSDQRSAYGAPFYAKHFEIPPSMRVYADPTCNFQSCNDPIDGLSNNFCPQHEQKLYNTFYAAYSGPSTKNAVPPSPPMSPLESPVDDIMHSRKHSSTSTTNTAGGTRTSVHNNTAVESTPPPVEQTMEPKVEAVSTVTEQGKHQALNENDTLPTFFSGVGVGLCLMLQIIHILLRLLLDLARGMGNRGIW